MQQTDTPDHFAFQAAEGDRNLRLDRFLADRLPAMSRSRIQQLIKDGHAVRDGRTIVEPNERVKPGETYEIAVPPPEDPEPKGEAIPIHIVYEDDDVIVIDKPAGLVVHPAAGNWTGTLVNALIAHCGDSLSGIGGVRRPGIVHRLDKETSGLMVVAKNDQAHQALAAQFADHGRTGPLQRKYTALVWGVPRPPKGTIKAALGRKSDNRLKIGVLRQGGREAITHYEVAEVYRGSNGESVASRVFCTLETGRTHQIRVHMAHIGHPLLGDPVYGTGYRTKQSLLGDDARNALARLERQALHAQVLGFAHPATGKVMRFEAPPPEDLQNVVKYLTSH
jgi:23S rRNA pseudouridine1911/1915/1917 synthase